MLKITKGLKPLVSKGISIYTTFDDILVRVKVDGEDFCITAHDYINAKDGSYVFTWDEAMESLKADGLTALTNDQTKICIDYYDEVNNKLKEIGGETLTTHYYWLSTECDNGNGWIYNGYKHTYIEDKRCIYRVRPILNL